MLTINIHTFYEQFDRQKGRVPGAVDRYMKQYNVSKEEACSALNIVVEDAWKDLAEEIFRPTTPIPMSWLMRIRNFCRVCNYVFKYENAFTMLNQKMKDALTLLFVEPVC